MWLPSDSFVLFFIPEAWAEKKGSCAVETNNHKLNHKSSKGLVHLLWKLIGDSYYTENKCDLTQAAGWLWGMEWGWVMASNVFLKEDLSLFPDLEPFPFCLPAWEWGLEWSLLSLGLDHSAKGRLSGGCRKGAGFKIPLSFPQLCYWLSLWPWAHQFFHWSKLELNCILCFFMSQILFLQNEDHNT